MLSGFELYPRWVPLICVRCYGITLKTPLKHIGLYVEALPERGRRLFSAGFSL